MKFPELTAAVIASRKPDLEARLRRLEDALAAACSAIDDVSWDGSAPAHALRPLADFFLQIQGERELEERFAAAELEDTVRTIAGEEPR